jgi:NADP-dependent 3-hydroxy acid dehydrogenase YdfG
MNLRALGADTTALITGASSGIGAETAAQLISKGCRVIAAARRIERLRGLADRLGPRCMPFELDVADRTAVVQMPERLPEAWRRIDVLVNNAGHDVGGKTPFHERGADDWASVIDTNIRGMIDVTRAVVPLMLDSGGGQIVNLGSIAGVTAFPGDAAYVASKHAVNGFSKALRLDYLGRIRVIEILPGVVETEFDEVRRRGDKVQARAFYAGFPERLRAEDVARCVVFALEQPPHANIAELLLLPSA